MPSNPDPRIMNPRPTVPPTTAPISPATARKGDPRDIAAEKQNRAAKAAKAEEIEQGGDAAEEAKQEADRARLAVPRAGTRGAVGEKFSPDPLKPSASKSPRSGKKAGDGSLRQQSDAGEGHDASSGGDEDDKDKSLAAGAPGNRDKE